MNYSVIPRKYINAFYWRTVLKNDLIDMLLPDDGISERLVFTGLSILAFFLTVIFSNTGILYQIFSPTENLT